MENKEPIRVEMLKQGAHITAGDRNLEYGEPKENFKNIAALWNAYLQRKYGISSALSEEDVAWLCVLMKIARTYIGQPKDDTYIDAAVYSAIAGELAVLSAVEPV